MPTAPPLPCLAPGCAHRRPCPVHPAYRRANHDVRKWYHLARWEHPVFGLRAQCLRRDPLCVVCVRAGVIVASTDADHVIPHRGDPGLFWSLANLQGLCHQCHAQKTRGEQMGGSVGG